MGRRRKSSARENEEDHVRPRCQGARFLLAVFCFFVVLPAASVVVRAGDFYVSPTGSANGDGSIGNPWDLYTAFNRGAVNPGDMIWLRGGVYWPRESSWESLECYLQGTANAPIIVRNYPGEHAILQNHPQYNGGTVPYVLLMKTGGYVWFWGLELRSTNTTRYTSTSGSGPSYGDLPLPNGAQITAPGVKLINMIIHDTRGGPGLFAGAVNAEAYGCIIYNNGWNAPDRGHGHGLYVQNLNGLMHLSDNIIFTQFGLGIHGYTEGSSLKHFLVERNAVFNNGRVATYPDPNIKEQILFGGGPPVQDLNILSNYVYVPLDQNSCPMRLDYAAVSNDNAVVANNYVAGGTSNGNYSVSAFNYQSVIFTNNTVYSNNGYLLQLQPHPGYVVDRNTYYGNSSANFNDGSSQYDFTGWKSATGFDSNSSYQQNIVPPNKVIVNPNAYEPKRANIIVYNWGNSNNVNVDVSSVLSPGDAFEVRNAQDYFAPPVLTGTYTGTPLTLPMTNLTTAVANGWSPTATPTTGRQFNAFVLQSATSGVTSQRFAITSITQNGNNLSITWNGLPGTNVVQVSNGAADGSYSNNFTDLATFILPTAGVTNCTDVGGATNASRFYRIDLKQ